MPQTSTADVLRKLLPQAEQDQEEIRSLRLRIIELNDRIAELEAALQDLQGTLEATREKAAQEAGVAQETIATLRSLLRRVREQASTEEQRLRAQVKQAEQRAWLAEQQAKQAQVERDLVEEECSRIQAERAYQEQSTNAVISRVEQDAQVRIQEAERIRDAAVEEEAEMARKLRHLRRRRRKDEVELYELRRELQVNEQVIQGLRCQLESRPPE